MERFDASDQLREMRLVFKKVDAFYNAFRKEFTTIQFELIQQFITTDLNPTEVYKRLELYADEMLNCADSVIYKDSDYSTHKLVEEVASMRKAVDSAIIEEHLNSLHFYVHKKSKELLVKHYPEIFDFSADGFRLLELYTNFYTREFVVNLNSHLKSKA